MHLNAIRTENMFARQHMLWNHLETTKTGCVAEVAVSRTSLGASIAQAFEGTGQVLPQNCKCLSALLYDFVYFDNALLD